MQYYVNHYDSKIGIWVIEGIFSTKKDAEKCRRQYLRATIQAI